MQIIEANGYNVEFGPIGESTFDNLLQKYIDQNILIICDENTQEHCVGKLIGTFDALSQAEVLVLPVGEESKELSIAEQVWETLTDYKITRHDLIINVGGGVVCDLGGFVASCYKRGVAFVNVPTSLLAMVDASIGGKNGINLNGLKNQIGLFTNPIAIYADIDFLNTLSQDEIFSGLGEMLKHGLIADADLFNEMLDVLEGDGELSDTHIIRSINIKNNIVGADPKEHKERKLLNFGHTLGHAVESFFMEEDYVKHGYCVVIGMVLESFISFRRGLLSQEDYEMIETRLTAIYPMPTFNDNDIQTIIGIIENDKKNRKGKILSCLIMKPGSCSYDHELSESEIVDAFMHFKNQQINLN